MWMKLGRGDEYLWIMTSFCSSSRKLYNLYGTLKFLLYFSSLMAIGHKWKFFKHFPLCPAKDRTSYKNWNNMRISKWSRKIINNSSHPSHSLLSLLPSGRRLRSIRSALADWGIAFFLRLSGQWTVRNNTPYSTLLQYAMHCTLTLTQFKLDYTHILHKYKNLVVLMHIHDIA